MDNHDDTLKREGDRALLGDFIQVARGDSQHLGTDGTGLHTEVDDRQYKTDSTEPNPTSGRIGDIVP